MALLSLQGILDALKSEIFKIGNFSIALWMIIVAIAILIVLVITIALCVKASKKKKALKNTKEIEDNDEPLETVTIISKEETKVDDEKEDSDETKVDEVKEDTKESEEEKMKAEPKKKTTTKKPTTKKEVKEEKVEEEKVEEEKVETEEKEKKERPRVYHVSMREDGKWQVKFAKGAKVIKTFATQLEAIDYAKKLAETQNGSITIHKKDGKIRKQKY